MELKDYLALQNKRRKPHKQEESQIQMELVNWLQRTYPDVIFTSALGGIKTTIGQAVKLKRLGYRKHWPDLFLAAPRKRFLGMMVELKKPKGTVDPGQRDLCLKLNNLGYKAVICYGLVQAQLTIQEYLG